MTDTGGRHEGVAACPFVAFAADRDRRAAVPDERHRCYAEDPPAPRAIGHQATFCLTPNFAGCSTFVDWAKRQGARAVPPAGAAAGAGAVAGAVAAAAAGDTGVLEAALEEGPSPPRRADAPPPWLSETPSGQLAFATPDDAQAPQDSRRDDEDDTHDLMDRAARGRSGDDAGDSEEDLHRRRSRLGEGAGAAAIAALSAGPGDDARPRSAASGPAPARPLPDDDVAPPAFLADRARARDAGPHGVTRFTERGPGRDAGPGDAAQARRGDPPRNGRRRRPDAYPRRRGMPTISPIVLGLGALLIAAALLFVLPTLFTNPPQIGLGPSGSPEPTVTVEPSPTAAPSPTPQQYTVQAGDTLSAIAAEFDLTLAELLAANPQITDPDTLSIGDVVTIPVPGAASASPSAAASSPAP